ncbi:uncharacterized protein LOC142337529 isoform X2 [Convolutriloba macropyga]|uniref:uncharacterized protein LOC142337529 isoform X2 n=1 Tax=Convolutriloba macropyga TaxID=536237 RepID=UPI003F5282C2
MCASVLSVKDAEVSKATLAEPPGAQIDGIRSGETGVVIEETGKGEAELEPGGGGKKKGKKAKKGGKGAKGKGKKGKKKKPKLTLAERRQLKMEKKITSFKSNRAEFLSFVERINHWRERHFSEVMEQCRKADKDSSGSLEYDTVKLILIDLDIPCNTLELEIVCRLVDTGDDADTCDLPSGYIDYEDFAQPIVAVLPSQEVQDLTSFKTLSDKTFYQHTLYPRYVTLHLRFLLFRDTPKCASHVTVNTTDDVTLDVVATEIKLRARLPNYIIEFYSEEDRDTMPVRNVQLAATFSANAVI